MENVYYVLNKLEITYEIFKHEPVYTVELALNYWKNIEAQHCKNIFFRDKKGKQHYLVILPFDKQLDINSINKYLGGERLSFASEKRLMKYLRLIPGSVSPFGLINDVDNHVKVLIDKVLQNADYLTFHPNDNSITLKLSNTNFFKFLDYIGNKYVFI